MNRLTIVAPILLAGAFCAGCRSDYYARKLIEHDTTYGKVGLTLTGTAEQLIQQGRIDLHRRIEGADKTPIDVWVIRGLPGGSPPRLDAAGAPPVGQGSPLGTMVLIHGLLDSKATYLPLGQRLARMGYDVVLPDLRAHGLSGGSYVTYGALEKRDVKAVMDSLLATGERDSPPRINAAGAPSVHVPVYVFGVSLGAAVAIQYAAMEPKCKGVMAMAPYKDARSITRRMVAFLAPMMSNADFEQTLARAGKIARFDPNDASALQAAGKLNCPILLVHGLLDTAVPLEHSQALYDAAKEPKQLIVVPWAGHASLLLAREAWIAEQIDTLAKTGLKKQASPPKEEEQ